MTIRSQKGFSIAELAVTTAILAVLATVTYPRLASLSGHYRLDTAARNLAAELQKTRFRAIAENACLRVNFNAAAKTYQVCKLTSGPCATSGTFAECASAKPIDSANSISVFSPNTPIFTSRGNVVTNTESTITLTGYQGWRQVLGVKLTGKVDVRL